MMHGQKNIKLHDVFVQFTSFSTKTETARP